MKTEYFKSKSGLYFQRLDFDGGQIVKQVIVSTGACGFDNPGVKSLEWKYASPLSEMQPTSKKEYEQAFLKVIEAINQ